MHLARASSAQSLTELIGWPRMLAFANLLLACSAILLVLPVAGVYALDSSDFQFALVVDLFFTALCVWPLFLAAVIAFAESGGEIPGIRRAAAVLSAALGLLGFVVGMASLPWAFPARVSSFFCAYEWECLLYGWFPYVPTVFAAVVVSHAAVAGIAGGQCRDGAAARRLRAAAVILILVSLVSLMAQFAGAFHGWAWGLVGLTAPGYLVAVAGAWRESRARATATPSPDPGGPSRGPSR